MTLPSRASPASGEVERAYRKHRRLLWGLCYRMTGCAADADDLVQETYARALERTPERLGDAGRAWLVRVALNLARDRLRSRRRTVYVGPWLPSPVELDEPLPANPVGESAELRYERLESATFAFLIALERLTPQQRAVLLLRDAYGYSVRETGEALDLSEANVKTTHHRARRRLRDYDARPCRPDPELCASHRDTIERFSIHLARGDTAGIEALLREDVELVTDGGGDFLAALRPVVGRARVVRFFERSRDPDAPVVGMEIRTLNGLPALVWESSRSTPRQARRYVARCELDSEGRIRSIHSITAPRKLSAVRFWDEV